MLSAMLHSVHLKHVLCHVYNEIIERKNNENNCKVHKSKSAKGEKKIFQVAFDGWMNGHWCCHNLSAGVRNSKSISTQY